ncbi:MAG: L-aspartate oxidase [Eggerthellaceae bacterium]|jgi:L-aspartate oxidase
MTIPSLTTPCATSEEIIQAACAHAPHRTLARRIPLRPALEFDVVIVGSGVSGCFAALHLPPSLRIAVLSKGSLDTCDSMLAQGGICVLHDPDDYESFYQDTLRAGHYENRAESVDIMIRSSRGVITELQNRGVRFATTPDGKLDYTREGAHSRPRICYHADITGREITTVLQRDLRTLRNVTIMEHTTMTDLLERPDGSCRGISCIGPDRREFEIHATDTILATGGIGGLYAHSTNFPLLTADGCRVAFEHGVRLAHMDYVQIHPTTLYTGKPGRSFLISESARGEGAILLDRNGRRFTDELQPRDVVSKAIARQMEADGTDYVLLSFERIDASQIKGHFPNIYERCLEEGYDITREPVPVVPAQHYFMGGIDVDSNSETSMPHLYAVGETSCNGVHGANRLASNSLLESLVFGQRAAAHIGRRQTGRIGRALAVGNGPVDYDPHTPVGSEDADGSDAASQRLLAEAERTLREAELAWTQCRTRRAAGAETEPEPKTSVGKEA